MSLAHSIGVRSMQLRLDAKAWSLGEPPRHNDKIELETICVIFAELTKAFNLGERGSKLIHYVPMHRLTVEEYLDFVPYINILFRLTLQYPLSHLIPCVRSFSISRTVLYQKDRTPHLNLQRIACIAFINMFANLCYPIIFLDSKITFINLPAVVNRNICSFLSLNDLIHLQQASLTLKYQIRPISIFTDFANEHGYLALVGYIIRCWMRAKNDPMDLLRMKVSFKCFIEKTSLCNLQWFLLQLVIGSVIDYKLLVEKNRFVKQITNWIKIFDGDDKAFINLYFREKDPNPRCDFNYARNRIEYNIEKSNITELADISLFVLADRIVLLPPDAILKFAVLLKKSWSSLLKPERLDAQKALRIFLITVEEEEEDGLDLIEKQAALFRFMFINAIERTIDRLILCLPRRIQRLDLSMLTLTRVQLDRILKNCPNLTYLKLSITKEFEDEKVSKHQAMPVGLTIDWVIQK